MRREEDVIKVEMYSSVANNDGVNVTQDGRRCYEIKRFILQPYFFGENSFMSFVYGLLAFAPDVVMVLFC